MALTPSTGLDKIKKVIGTEVLLCYPDFKKVFGIEMQVPPCYPDFNKPLLFHLNTDASDHQLGAIIIQDRNPIAFYS
jgi:hypothetical protein